MHRNLRDFIKVLEREDQLIVIEAEVDPYLEIAEIHRRVIEEQGKALLFTNVKGSPFPVVTNLFGTLKRIELAFGSKPVKFVRDVVHLAETALPPRFNKLWESRGLLKTGIKLGTRSVTNAPVLERKQPQVDLDQLPLLQLCQQRVDLLVALQLVHARLDIFAKKLGLSFADGFFAGDR